MKGYSIKALLPSKPGEPGPMEVKAVDYDVLLTAETHNFPTGTSKGSVSPPLLVRGSWCHH
jgi:phosphoribosylformylglycinamidine synthase